MAYLWSPVLETGHDKIDEQHKQLLEALNGIANAFKQGTGDEELLKTLAFLTNYTVMHFTTEEDLMKEYDYHGYQSHRKTHEDFKVIVSQLTQRLQKEGPSEDLIVTVTAIIGDWLISHIRVDDVRMAKFIKSRKSGA